MTLAEALKESLVAKGQIAAGFAVVELRSQLRDDTPKRTGRTSRGWSMTPPVFDGTAVEFRVQHPQGPENPPDPEWLNSGTRAHVIVARRAKVLAFPGASGETVFRRSVQHPGFAGTGFIDRVMAPGNLALIWQAAMAAAGP